MTAAVEPARPAKKSAPAKQADEAQPSAATAFEAVRAELTHQAKTRPYTTVLVAVGAGYILGVATPKWATQLAMNTLGRVALARLLAAV